MRDIPAIDTHWQPLGQSLCLITPTRLCLAGWYWLTNTKQSGSQHCQSSTVLGNNVIRKYSNEYLVQLAYTCEIPLCKVNYISCLNFKDVFNCTLKYILRIAWWAWGASWWRTGWRTGREKKVKRECVEDKVELHRKKSLFRARKWRWWWPIWVMGYRAEVGGGIHWGKQGKEI